jgi:hypothetical protein
MTAPPTMIVRDVWLRAHGVSPRELARNVANDLVEVW